MRRFTSLLLGLVVAGCAPTVVDRSPDAPGGPPAAAGVPRCVDVPPIAAPAEAYADSPVYVGNEMPVEAIREWAIGQPGYQEIWIDRDHHGWVTVAFSHDAGGRQADLEREFPGVGVVAVEVDWTTQQLEDLQSQIMQQLGGDLVSGSATLPMQGKVSVFIGPLTAERIAAVEAAFAGEPICLEGVDPASLPEPGPQHPGGMGWRLLADEQTGPAYRTGIAWDAASLADLWATAHVSAPVPNVDFGREVVLWFGAVYSGSCPDIRLDGVVIDGMARRIHAEITALDQLGVCTADANGRAYLVAVERALLPGPPFHLQLGADPPPAGVPEERTVVEADLRAPWSIAAPEQIHGDPALFHPGVTTVESGGFVEPEFPFFYRLSTRCGVEWFGVLNDVTWRATSTDAADGWIPDRWRPAILPGDVVIGEVLLSPGPEPAIGMTVNGHTETYRPSSDAMPACP